MPETFLTIEKFGARVKVEDKEVAHYAVQVDPVKKEVSCWIASEAGKKFSVVWLELDVDFPTRAWLYLDEHHIAGMIRLRTTGPLTFEHLRISGSLATPYLFSPVIVTDDDAFLDGSTSHSVGEIKLVIYRTDIPTLAADQETPYTTPPEPQKVHERTAKAITHRINYGGEVIAPQQTLYHAENIEMLVTFIFNYRPLEMLQANGIAPRNPEPSDPQGRASKPSEKYLRKRKPSEVKEEPKSDEEAEDNKREEALLAEVQGHLDEIQRRQAEIQRCIAEVQRIKNTTRLKLDDGHPKKKVKKENKALFIPDEVIDLT